MNKERKPEDVPIAGIDISSLDMAGLIVDALIDGGVVQEKDRSKAEEIATEEIWIRKLLVDGPQKESG